MNITCKWTNWARNLCAYPHRIFYPKSLEALINIVKDVSQKKSNLRVVGSSHSWSDLVSTNNYLISLKYLNKILSIDKNTSQVQVQSGITLRELNYQLNLLNLTLPNQSAIVEQTLGGAIATATHGTGNTGTLSDFIIQIELIDGHAKLIKITKEDSDLFAAACVNLGSLGIIYTITLQCKSKFYLKERRKIVSLQNILSSYKRILQENDNFQFYVNLYTNKVLISTFNRIESHKITTKSWISFFLEKLISSSIVSMLFKKIMQLFPSITPRFMDIVYNSMAKEEKYGLSYKILAADSTGIKRIEEEIAVSQDDLPQAISDLQKIAHKYSKQDSYILAVVCRFSSSSTTFLSPSSGRDTAYISISTISLDQKLYHEFEAALAKYNGRPHWAKINFLNYGKALNLYGNNFLKFIKIREQLDPEKLFSNSFTQRIFEDSQISS